MKISFENPDKVNGLLTLTVEEADYKENVEKTLKSYRKKANIPGFRPGQVPMSLVKRQFGASVKMDEINKFVGEQIYKYVQDNKIQMLGEPLPSEKQERQDLENESTFTFVFDIAWHYRSCFYCDTFFLCIAILIQLTEITLQDVIILVRLSLFIATHT